MTVRPFVIPRPKAVGDLGDDGPSPCHPQAEGSLCHPQAEGRLCHPQAEGRTGISYVQRDCLSWHRRVRHGTEKKDSLI